MDPFTVAGVIGVGLGKLFAAYKNGRRISPASRPQFNVMIHDGGYVATIPVQDGIYALGQGAGPKTEYSTAYLTINFVSADYGAERLQCDDVVLLLLEDATEPDFEAVLLTDVLAGHFSLRLPAGLYRVGALVVDQSQDRLLAYGMQENLRLGSSDNLLLTLPLEAQGAAELEAALLAAKIPQPLLLAPDGQMWPIADLVLLGRGPDCHLIIDDQYVSRRHAELMRLDDESYQIRDLGSVNGTYVNGYRAWTTVVIDGDAIQIGGLTLRILFA